MEKMLIYEYFLNLLRKEFIKWLYLGPLNQLNKRMETMICSSRKISVIFIYTRINIAYVQNCQFGKQ